MRFAVASGHESVCHTVEEILLDGGHAIDAVVSASFVSCVVEPLLTSLGGGGYALIHEAQSPKPICYDFFVNFPGEGKNVEAPVLTEVEVQFETANQKFHSGKGSIAVPGLLKGLLHLQGKYGSLPLERILRPSIQLAEEGHLLNSVQNHVAQLLTPVLKQSYESKELFFNGGENIPENFIYQNKKLADYLKGLINNQKLSFYNSPFAEKIQKDVQNHSPLLAKNLLDYKVIEAQPLEFKYHDATIYTVAPPAQGGLALKKLMESFERENLSQHKWGSEGHLISLQKILSEDLENEDHPFKKGTTHISVFDKKYRVSLSMTNGEGSGYYPPHSGIMLNNMLGEEDVCGDDHKLWTPNKRLPSMMAPCLVQLPNDEEIVLGTGGSKRIRSSLAQVISGLVDFDMRLDKAIRSPRVNWDGTQLQMEPGFPHNTIEKLKNQLSINLWSKLNFFFGGVHSVHTGQKAAVGDPRRAGAGLKG